ncbi:MAG: WbqC family protein [Candidatus Paceibacterota bacterium]|jgi:hypothetical protein
MKKVAILQSNYIPWKGVFDMINQVDTFVFHEDVQYTKQDWRNRNKIKTPNGLEWLTVPVKKSPETTKIFEIEISNKNWQRNHYNKIIQNYSKAPFLKEYHFILENIYLKNTWVNLSQLNIYTTKLIANVLGIKTKFINSIELKTIGIKDDKVIDICKRLNATHYLSGPAAKGYIKEDKFRKANIELEYIKYEYPEYNQLYGEFNHYVSVLDVIFNCGKDSPKYIFQNKFEKIIL